MDPRDILLKLNQSPDWQLLVRITMQGTKNNIPARVKIYSIYQSLILKLIPDEIKKEVFLNSENFIINKLLFVLLCFLNQNAVLYYNCVER